eukprot:1056252-Prymnesium_polylepis.1
MHSRSACAPSPARPPSSGSACPRGGQAAAESARTRRSSSPSGCADPKACRRAPSRSARARPNARDARAVGRHRSADATRASVSASREGIAGSGSARSDTESAWGRLCPKRSE